MNEKYDLCDIDESYLHTVSMTELFDSAYQSKPPIIDGLLYRGTYLFAGSPKIGKSFLMAQLAYHVSTGTNLWGFDVRQGKVLYLALEDNYPRLQKRLYRMFGTAENENLFFSVSAHQLGNGLDEYKIAYHYQRTHDGRKITLIFEGGVSKRDSCDSDCGVCETPTQLTRTDTH